MQALRRLKRKEEAEEKQSNRLGSMLGRLQVDEPARSPNRLKVPWKRRTRKSEESSASTHSGTSVKLTSTSHTPTSSIGGASGGSWNPGVPFPLIRSHSSISGLQPQLPEGRGRSLTEGEHPLELTAESSAATVEDPPLPSFDETTDPGDFLRMVEVQNRGGRLCMALAQVNSSFLKRVMHLYISIQFIFVNEPIDIALRKFLLVVKLPVETQQTERVLECFSQVYHEQNPSVFTDSQQAYFVVFSIVILHTDYFNKNVRHKMSKEDYVRSAYCDDIPIEFFEYIYENTTAAQFIHAEDSDTRRSTPTPTITNASLSGGSFSGGPVNTFDTETVSSRRTTSFGWRSDLIVDPYIPILENNVAAMRPNLNSVVSTKDPFIPCFVETPREFLLLRERFVEGPTIQLVSHRSRPDAWQNDVEDRARLSTQNLLQITTPGVVEIKVVKIGILLRREAPKRMLYSKASWKEWGALLTESQLYLFKNAAWIKSILLDTENGPIIRAPIDEFNATTVSSTKDMAAMFMVTPPGDRQHQFSLTGRGGSQQWFVAADQEDCIDWVHNINFAAAFSTYHVGPVPAHLVPPPAGAMSPTDKLLRSASDSSLSVQPQRKLRTNVLSHQLKEIDRKIATIQEQINLIERDSTNLQMLMPLQQKTKEMVMFAVGQCSSKCEYCWLDRARLRCYKNMLELDLRCEEDAAGRPQRTPEPIDGLSSTSSLTSHSSRAVTPEHLKLSDVNNDDTVWVDASGPTSPRSSRNDEGVYIAPNRQFSFVNMNPDLVNSSPLSSTKSISSLAPQRSESSIRR